MSHSWCSTGGAREFKPRFAMKSIGNLCAAFAFIALAVMPSRAVLAADDTAWTAAKVQGTVHIRNGNGAWKRLREGEQLGAFAEIISGENGSAVLVRGVSTIHIARETRVEVPMVSQEEQASIFGITPEQASLSLSRSQKGGKGPRAETVTQSFGTTMYKVKPLPGRRFKVKTPHLVATIKGTVFTVSVNDAGAAVHVSEGLVEVTSPSGDDVAMVPAGHTVSVDIKRHKNLEMRSLSKKQAASRRTDDLHLGHQDSDKRDHDRVVFRKDDRDTREHNRDRDDKDLAKLGEDSKHGKEFETRESEEIHLKDSSDSESREVKEIELSESEHSTETGSTEEIKREESDSEEKSDSEESK